VFLCFLTYRNPFKRGYLGPVWQSSSSRKSMDFVELLIPSSKNPWIWSCGWMKGICLSHFGLILKSKYKLKHFILSYKLEIQHGCRSWSCPKQDLIFYKYWYPLKQILSTLITSQRNDTSQSNMKTKHKQSFNEHLSYKLP